MALITWPPEPWDDIKNDWTSDDEVTEEDFNAIADSVIQAQEGMDALVAAVSAYIIDESWVNDFGQVLSLGGLPYI